MAKLLLNRSLYINMLIAFSSVLIALIFVELLLRFFFIRDFTTDDFLFISKSALQDQEENFGFKKNTEIRAVSVHWNGNKFEIVYDNIFSTINIGLVQKNLLSQIRNPLFSSAIVLPKV